MKNTKYSVLMSVYYKEKPEFFIQSIESIIRQSMKPDEIVIVKDGPLTPKLDEVLNEGNGDLHNPEEVVELGTLLGKEGIEEAMKIDQALRKAYSGYNPSKHLSSSPIGGVH